MFDLEQQASGIVARLEEVEEIATVAYIDQEDQVLRHPATMPAAFVTLARVGVTAKQGNSVMVALSWTIIIKSKQLEGPGGCLPVIDLVLDTLGGFVPAVGVNPLMPEKVEMLERRGEAIEYAVVFTTNRQAIMPFNI